MPSINKDIRTGKGTLMYITITGEGRNGAMKGQPERMQYMASVVFKKDSPEHKELEAQIKEVWAEYSKANGVKGAPKSLGIKPVMEETDELDEYGAKIKVPTDEVIATFKTDVKWKDGNAKIIDVFQPSGKKCTEAIQKADWKIGNGTLGKIYGVASANDVGGTHKVSLYLSAVQLAGNLVKYTGSTVQAEAMDDVEDMEFDEDLNDVSASNESEKPAI